MSPRTRNVPRVNPSEHHLGRQQFSPRADRLGSAGALVRVCGEQPGHAHRREVSPHPCGRRPGCPSRSGLRARFAAPGKRQLLPLFRHQPTGGLLGVAQRMRLLLDAMEEGAAPSRRGLGRTLEFADAAHLQRPRSFRDPQQVLAGAEELRQRGRQKRRLARLDSEAVLLARELTVAPKRGGANGLGRHSRRTEVRPGIHSRQKRRSQTGSPIGRFATVGDDRGPALRIRAAWLRAGVTSRSRPVRVASAQTPRRKLISRGGDEERRDDHS